MREVQNDNREGKKWRQIEREIDNSICQNCEPNCKESKIIATAKHAKESITTSTTKENSQPQYFYWYRFLRINEIINYFDILG